MCRKKDKTRKRRTESKELNKKRKKVETEERDRKDKKMSRKWPSIYVFIDITPK